MGLFSEFFLYAIVFRLAIIAAGTVSIILGYRLFTIGSQTENETSRETTFDAKMAGLEFALKNAAPGTFFALFLELWQVAPFAVPAADEIDTGLLGQLTRYRDGLGTGMPAGAMLTFLRCWTLLYGAVSMEVFGHMSFALEDPAPMFEFMLGDLASMVGLRYPPRP